MNDPIIVTEPSAKLRELARHALKGNWIRGTVVVALFNLCITVPGVFLYGLLGGFASVTEELGPIGPITYSTGYWFGFTVYPLLVTGALTLGQSMFFITMFRRSGNKITQLFLGFENFLKAFGLHFMTSLLIAVWMLPLIIIGIIILVVLGINVYYMDHFEAGMVFFLFVWILALVAMAIFASFRYSQAFYLLVDDPKKSVMQCIRESKEMMRGNKGKLLALNFSFIGWALLLFVAYYIAILAIVFGFSSAFLFEGAAGGLIILGILLVLILILAFSIGVYMLTAYMETANVAFYHVLSGRLPSSAPVRQMVYQQQADVQSGPQDNTQPSPLQPEEQGPSTSQTPDMPKGELQKPPSGPDIP